MRLRLPLAVAAVAALAAVAAGSAFAHAQISPPVALAKAGQVFTLAVPTEKEDATHGKVVLTVPDGFSIDSFVAAPGLEARGAADRLGRGRRDPEGDLDGREGHRARLDGAPAGRGRVLPVPGRDRRGEDLRVPGRADLLRRLRRRLVRRRGLRHARADGRGASSSLGGGAAARARRSRSSRSSSARSALVLGGDRARPAGAAGSSREARAVARIRARRRSRPSRCRPRRVAHAYLVRTVPSASGITARVAADVSR